MKLTLNDEQLFLVCTKVWRVGREECKNCSNYPTGSDVETSTTKLTYGELCNECKNKEANGTCQQ